MLTVGIADDHALFRKGMMELINGFSDVEVVLEASNGQELISQLKEDSLPDIIVLDINMPVMDGYATASAIKAKYPEAKILGLSMYGDEQSVIRMLRSGANGYILKDAEPKELEEGLRDLAKNGFYYSNEAGKLLLNNMHRKPEQQLKDRELEFLELVSTELTYKEIADKMCVSPRTVDGYREALFEKLKVRSRVGLVVYAIKHGIYKLE